MASILSRNRVEATHIVSAWVRCTFPHLRQRLGRRQGDFSKLWWPKSQQFMHLLGRGENKAERQPWNSRTKSWHLWESQDLAWRLSWFLVTASLYEWLVCLIPKVSSWILSRILSITLTHTALIKLKLLNFMTQPMTDFFPAVRIGAFLVTIRWLHLMRKR